MLHETRIILAAVRTGRHGNINSSGDDEQYVIIEQDGCDEWVYGELPMLCQLCVWIGGIDDGMVSLGFVV